MTSIRVPDIWQLQLMAVKNCVVDSVPFVRKIAAHSLLKLYQWDPSQLDSVIAILKILLREVNALVFSSAIIAYNEICPTRYDLLTPCYRRMIDMLPMMDDAAQVITLTVLMKYARTQFLQPKAIDLANVDKEVLKPVVAKAQTKAAKKEAASKATKKLDGTGRTPSHI